MSITHEQHTGVKVNAPSGQAMDESSHMDVVSQFPFLNGYTHLVFLFKPDGISSHDTIVATLRNALGKLTTHVPWLAGQVLHQPGPPGSSGQYTLAPWPVASTHKEDMLRVEDCEERMPPLATILRAGAPVSMLDASILTPFPSLPVPHGLKPPLPVMVLQLNFLRGGVILNLAAHHMAVDGNGMVQIMRLLATLLQGREIETARLEQANRDRRRVVQLLSPDEPVKDHSHLYAPPGHITAPPSTPPRWCYYKIPLSALTALKTRMAPVPSQQQQAQPQPQPQSQPLVSDNDVLCAFCWQRITAVRLARGVSTNTLSKMTRIIDARATLGIPITYMGHLTYYAYVQLPMGEVTSQPLSSVAQMLRRELNAANTSWAVRSFATFLSREPDKSRLVYAGLRNFDTDLGTTALSASQSTHPNGGGGGAMPDDFGPVLGRLLHRRRPNCSPLPGGITICPVERGSIPIVVCLPEADLQGLRHDTEWNRHVRHIG